MLKQWVEKLRIALGDRRHAYRTTFSGPYGEVVLKDLARFCRAHASTVHPDPRVQEGFDNRREVWLRIEHHLKLTPDELWELYSGLPAKEE